MATEVKRRRGTTDQHNGTNGETGFTGAVAELTVDLTKDTVVVHDGATQGGFPLLREDFSNAVFTVPDGRYLQLSGGTLTNSLTISANTPQLVLKDSTDSSFNVPPTSRPCTVSIEPSVSMVIANVLLV